MKPKVEIEKLAKLNKKLSGLSSKKTRQQIANALIRMSKNDIDVGVGLFLEGRKDNKVSLKKNDLENVITYSTKLLTDDMKTA